MRQALALLVALTVALAPLPVAALPVAAPAPADRALSRGSAASEGVRAAALALRDASQLDILRRLAALIELGVAADGRLEVVRGEERTPLPVEQEARVSRFLSTLDAAEPELGMALALRGYLSARMPAAQVENNMFLKRGEDGVLKLTETGRKALLDILLASDGQLLESATPPKGPTPLLHAEAGPQAPGGLAAAVGRSLDANGIAALDPEAAFDGSRHRLGAFDWSALGPNAVQAGGTMAVDQKRLEGWSYDAEAGTVRVMVAGRSAVAVDRLKSAGDGAGVYEEAGLDRSLFEGYGAKVVRAVDNLVTVDVPLAQAAAMGLALQDVGVESRPARLFKAAAGALASPVAGLLGTALLPFPSAGTIAALAVAPQLADARSLVGGEALERAGMRGKGTLVGVIDSGIDPDHPDFQDAAGNSRIASYLDFTSEGNDDVVGHGTHVAGTILGSGAASDGELRGSATEARLKMAKVFGVKGETDESVILAAMKWMAGGAGNGEKVDILNMSLGGPGVPNVDPLSSMANWLTAKAKMLVVAAAGNDGPWTGSVGSPGNARYALTVGGVTKEGKVAFFSSRGPVVDEQNRELYGKPDLLGVSGDVDLSRVNPALLVDGADPKAPAAGGLASLAGAASESCIYAPGVAAPRSSHDTDKLCSVSGNANYRYMSGTSMAAPQVAGMAADVVGYLKAQGYEVDPFEVKALLMETARELAAEGKDVQGAGLVNGEAIAQSVVDRVKRGLPVGNVAFSLSMRLTQRDRAALSRQSRYQLTPLGLLDNSTGHLVRDEGEIAAALGAIRSLPATTVVSTPAAGPTPT
ncbi:MAG: S8 family serine peptidase [Elusimicrobia bacterium]|nr:S8 family serine peptidase [Elusimicrobiota bacterium]